MSELLNNTTTKLNFGAIPYRENEVMKSHVDLSEILKLGWRANICLEDGLRKTIEEEKRIV